MIWLEKLLASSVRQEVISIKMNHHWRIILRKRTDKTLERMFSPDRLKEREAQWKKFAEMNALNFEELLGEDFF